ncbi:MAG: CAP domain-containing protein [Flavobacteriales bacterium]
MLKISILLFIFLSAGKLLSQDYYSIKPSDFTVLSELDKPVKNGDKALVLLEAAVWHYINIEREKKRIKLLTYDVSLQQAARFHSEQMCEKKFFSHTGKDPKMKSPHQRIMHFGGKYKTTGENIVEDFLFEEVEAGVIITPQEFYIESGKGKTYPYTYRQLAQILVKSWMKSPPHKANILDKSYTHGAIGISLCPADGKKYKDFRVLATQCFGGK